MKKLYLLLLLPFFFACSSDDAEIELKQNYTSFVVKSEHGAAIKNLVVGFLQADGTWLRVATIGDIADKTTSKEIKVDHSKVKEVSLFFDSYKTDGTFDSTRKIWDELSYSLEENIKNIIIIPYSFSAPIVVVKDPKQYPIE